MSWHTDSYPGLLALLCTGQAEDSARLVQELCEDYQAFLGLGALVETSTFHKNLQLMSLFHTRPLSELVDLLPAVGTTLPAGTLEFLQDYSRSMWSGWGQSKVIEDANKEAREKESRDSTSKVLKEVKQWDALRSRGVIVAHGRVE
eukprot:9645527-Lingulodinium_polyedra.AAC.1